jgi:hypothetical protein
MSSYDRTFISSLTLRRPARTLGVTAALLGLVAACAPGPVPISRSSRDPSSPSAPEGVAPVASVASADGDAQAVVYVCPMHPEVTSNAPGICPKCNMKLVPKK